MNFINSRTKRFLLLTALVMPFLLIAASAKAQPEAEDNQNTTLAQRLVERESIYKNRLANVSDERIASRCKSAQSRLTAFRTQTFEAGQKRQEIYKKISGRLDSIVKHLNEHQVDTAELSAAQKEFNDSVNGYNENLEDYKAAIDDLISVSCITDPSGFYASLLDAREYRDKMAADASAVRAVVPKLASALQTASQELTHIGAEH